MPPRRVLIVSPHFPPVNAPDHQRVRMSLPYLREFGWEAHVLAVVPDQVEAARDPDLLLTIPDTTTVTRVGALPYRWTRLFGLGSLGIRAFGPLLRAGTRLLKSEKFDLIYFSTTIFAAMALGPKWKKQFKIPYVIDMQDPWVSDYYEKTGTKPPGGWFKYAFAQWQARRREPSVMRHAVRIVSVSPAYPEMLRRRYPGISEDRFIVLPFGAPSLDMEIVKRRGITHSIFDSHDGLRHWVYLGRGGADMAKGLRGLFLALASLRPNCPEVDRLRLHFVGTSYAPQGVAERTVEPVARECGVADLVSEQTQRIPYLEGLALLQSCSVILIVGSDDPGYSASKVYPCILAGRPILAVLHEASLAGSVILECQAGSLVGFRSEESDADLAKRIIPKLRELLERPIDATGNVDCAAFERYSARSMTRRQCAVFDEAITP